MHGDTGWTFDIPRHKLDENGTWVVDNNKKVTAMDYYAYRMHTRDNPNILDIQEDTVTYGGLLKQQYDCENWIKIEEQRLYGKDKIKNSLKLKVTVA